MKEHKGYRLTEGWAAYRQQQKHEQNYQSC